ncbi:Hypothetical_protein [Hexamita inflata]|uniref:Hypothetical_protein n=1 Tax=Hexamita inflata TaxID=28002 RepID=A0AA86R8F1_9EUKA|nr:Hypothetical protein HINF_LOCUS56891 [Hexamita inflata]
MNFSLYEYLSHSYCKSSGNSAVIPDYLNRKRCLLALVPHLRGLEALTPFFQRDGLFIIYYVIYITLYYNNIIAYITFEQRPLTNSSGVKRIYSSLNSDSLTDKLLIQLWNMS